MISGWEIDTVMRKSMNSMAWTNITIISIQPKAASVAAIQQIRKRRADRVISLGSYLADRKIDLVLLEMSL